MLLDDVNDIETRMRSLDVTRLDHLKYLLGCINDVEELRMKPDHPNNIHNQILRMPLYVGEDEDEAESVADFHVFWLVCIEIFYDLYY